jgi:hypothetical protein
MARCPRCNVEYQREERFCMHCGSTLVGTEEGHLFLAPADLAALAGSNEYSPLSPLAPHYAGPVRDCGVSLAPPLKDAVLSPTRAFYLMEISRDAFAQEVLLVRDGARYHWSEGDSGASIREVAAPRDFLDEVRGRLVPSVSGRDAWPLITVTKTSLQVLTGVAVLCRDLSRLGKAASFVTLSHLEAFLGRQVPAGQIAELTGEGLVKTLGDDDPVIVLEARGEELYLLLNEYERYFIIQVLTSGALDYPSLGIAVRDRTACLITNPSGGADIVVRGLDPDAITSLVNWAWTAGTSASGVSSPPVGPKVVVPGQPATQATATYERQTLKAEVEQGHPVAPDLPPPVSRSSISAKVVIIAAIALFVLIIAAAGAGYWYYINRTAPSDAAGSVPPKTEPAVPARVSAPQAPAPAAAQVSPGRTGGQPRQEQPKRQVRPAQPPPQKSQGSWVDRTLGPAPAGPVRQPSVDPRDMGR